METETKSKSHWYHPTPGRLLIILLAVEGVLLLSERWFPKGWSVLIAIASVVATILFLLLWLVLALLFHKRFQFSILSLMVLTIAVAIPSSWLAVEMRWARKQREVVGALIKVGGTILSDDKAYSQFFQTRATPPGQAWLRTVLGDDFFIKVDYVSLYDSFLIPSAPQITNVDLEQLKELKQIEILDLQCTFITDAGLEHVKGLKQLKILILDFTQITDTGLEHLKELKKLQWLSLIKIQITDGGLEHLKEMKQLHTLSLEGTKVTDAGIAELQQALPNCDIRH